MANAKPHVKKHLEKSNVKPEELGDSVIEALNQFKEAELNAMYDLVGKEGLAGKLAGAQLTSKQIIAAVH
jgi:hypothetical protein